MNFMSFLQQQPQNKQRRPPAKPFNEEDIRAIGGEVTTQGSFKMFESNEYNAKGFLIKTFYPSAFIYEGVKPTLSELSKFEDKPESVSLDCKYSSVAEVHSMYRWLVLLT